VCFIKYDDLVVTSPNGLEAGFVGYTAHAVHACEQCGGYLLNVGRGSVTATELISQNTGKGSFTRTGWTVEQEHVRPVSLHGFLQSADDVFVSHNLFECGGPILSV
jgi:hypothetical protein